MTQKTQRNIRRVRRYALTLVNAGQQNFASPSTLSQQIAETDYALTPERELFALARTILQAARLTTFSVQTRADAVSVIEGIRPAGRANAR